MALMKTIENVSTKDLAPKIALLWVCQSNKIVTIPSVGIQTDLYILSQMVTYLVCDWRLDIQKA